MEAWGRVLSGIATVALLLGSGAGLAARRRGGVERGLDWGWRAGALVGAGALCLGVILRSAAAGGAPFSSVGDRAAVVALVAALALLGSLKRRQPGWAGLVPVAVVAGISALGWPVQSAPAPVLVACTLAAAGLGLWSAGRGLHALAEGQEDSGWAAMVALAGLTLSVVVVGGVNWRVWGTPSGSGAFLGLAAAWLVNAARLVLGRNSAWLAVALDLLAAAALVGIGLSAQWELP